MKTYRIDARLDKVLKMATKGANTLPYPEAFWEGLQALKIAGVDLEWSRGKAIKRTVFERLGVQITSHYEDPQHMALVHQTFERLWTVLGGIPSAQHTNGWHEITSVSYAIAQDSPDFFAGFVKWFAEGLRRSPSSKENIQSVLNHAHLATLLDRPDLLEALEDGFPAFNFVRHQHDHMAHDFANVKYAGPRILEYLIKKEVSLREPIASMNGATLEEIMRQGPGQARSLVGPAARAQEMNAALPKATHRKPGPRF